MSSVYRVPGSLTFRSVSGGRLRCNQRPDLPPMSAQQADQLRKGARNAVRPKPPKQLDNSGKAPQEITAKATANTIKCPFCRHEHLIRIGMNHCNNCRGPFYVEQRRRLGSYDY